MIALIIVTLLLPPAVLLGWYGHKIYVRIQLWGEKLNEQDAIFQAVAPREPGDTAPAPGRKALPQQPCFPDPVPLR